MAQALAAVVEVQTETRSPRDRVTPLRPVSRKPDVGLTTAFLTMTEARRSQALPKIRAVLEARGVDPVVCDFVEDDLREATEALSDIEAFFQESVEALLKPTASVLYDRAADASVFERLDHLYETLHNLRRRMVQVSARVRRR